MLVLSGTPGRAGKTHVISKAKRYIRGGGGGGGGGGLTEVQNVQQFLFLIKKN